KTILFTLLASCERARNLSMSFSPSQRCSLFRLRLHCAPSFTQQFRKPHRIIRRRLDIHGACFCSLCRSRRSGGGLPAALTCNFQGKHFGEPSLCSRQSGSCWICSLATPSSFSQIKRRRSVAKYPQWVVRFQSRSSSSTSLASCSRC